MHARFLFSASFFAAGPRTAERHHARVPCTAPNARKLCRAPTGGDAASAARRARRQTCSGVSSGGRCSSAREGARRCLRCERCGRCVRGCRGGRRGAWRAAMARRGARAPALFPPPWQRSLTVSVAKRRGNSLASSLRQNDVRKGRGDLAHTSKSLKPTLTRAAKAAPSCQSYPTPLAARRG